MTTIEPRTSVVPIYGGDYQDRLKHLDARIDAAEKAEGGTTRTNDEGPESHTLIEEYNALAEEAERAATHVRVRALRRSAWRALVADHPPRTGDDVPESTRKSDERLGVNETTFREVLVPAAIVDLTEDGVTRAWSDLSEADREEFLDVIADADFEALFIHAYSLVNSFSASPKARVSPPIPKSAETPS